MLGQGPSFFDGAISLVCPIDRHPIKTAGSALSCTQGHRYNIAGGIPIMLTEAPPTHWGFRCIDPDEAEKVVERDAAIRRQRAAIDPDVIDALVGTGGNLYRAVKNLPRYPIPEIRLPDGDGKVLVELGCNWGRWSIAAARKGYRVIGVDPSLSAILAGRRVAEQLGLDIQFLMGDARSLPIETGAIDCVFSYSVLQHLQPQDAWKVLSETRRVLKPGGTSLIQMANCFGLRSFYNQVRRGFNSSEFFAVRYYRPSTIRAEMENRIGPTKISVDGFFGLGIQPADYDLLPKFERMVISGSEAMRYGSRVFPPLKLFADSLYFECQAKS